jgi:hypothetical protein
MGILNFYPGMTRRMFTSEVRLEAGISHLTMYLIRIAVYILLQKYKKSAKSGPWPASKSVQNIVSISLFESAKATALVCENADFLLYSQL